MTDYKKSLLMPTTKFEMKANLATKEVKIQKEWIFNQVEKKINAKNKNNTPFILHDGPPYANGDIHIGHAMNKILKDIIVRNKSMLGFYSRYIPGWDTHGLPIEHALLKLGVNNDKNLSIIEKRKNCYDFAIKHVYQQIDQFKRLGILSSMDHFYITCDLDYVVRQFNIFNKLIQKKLIFQAFKPVYWSWSSQTALADGEIIYQQVESDSIYVALKVTHNHKVIFKNDNLLIWTTTPYTLPSNLAVCVNPKIKYARVKVNDQYYIISFNLFDFLSQKLKWQNPEVISTFLGKELEHGKYLSPLTLKECPILIDSYVSAKDGTGIVHNAPGFGLEDYIVCKRYHIDPYCPVDQYGKFTADVYAKELVDVFYDDANKWIINELQKHNTLVFHEKITHSTACDWRTKKPVIYRATKQWFISVKAIFKDIVNALKPVKSVDKSIVLKIKEMILQREEWCISRQRIWGVPICVIYDKDLNPILDRKLMTNIIKVLNDEGIDTWYQKDAKYFLPKGYSLQKKYIKETDIMDVWFDSGTSYSVLQHEKLSYPADLYFEGKDQFRGWFNSSLITSVAAFNVCPYKNLLTHGFILDSHGNKMSKSIGNVVDPLDVCAKYGADVLRLWVASCDYLKDVRISKEILEQISGIYRKIRNTLFKFILGNLNNFVWDNKRVEYSEFDLYILNRFDKDLKTIKNYYKKYDFKNIVKLVSNNVTFLSAWYFDYIKDSLYCDLKTNPKRVAIQKVLYLLLDAYLRILAPIIPHTCEEAYTFFNKKNKLKSVHLESFPTFSLKPNQKVDLKKWEQIARIKDLIYSALEKAKNDGLINTRDNALVIVKSKTPLLVSATLLKDYLQLTEVKFEKDSKAENPYVEIKKLDYEKCLRCWNYYKASKIKKDLCNRCNEVLKIHPMREF